MIFAEGTLNIGINADYDNDGIGEYSEYNYLEEILKDTISFKVVDDDLNIKYQTIKDYNLDKY